MGSKFKRQAETRNSAAEDNEINLIHRYPASNNVMQSSLLRIILMFLLINSHSHRQSLHTRIVNQADQAAQRDRDPLWSIVELVPKFVQCFVNQVASQQ
jgi:hypothetical protein